MNYCYILKFPFKILSKNKNNFLNQYFYFLKEVTSAVPADNPRISTLFLPKASKFKTKRISNLKNQKKN